MTEARKVNNNNLQEVKHLEFEAGDAEGNFSGYESITVMVQTNSVAAAYDYMEKNNLSEWKARFKLVPVE